MSNIRWSHKMHQRFRMRFQLNIRFYWCLWSSKFDLEVLHLRIFQWNNSTDMKILDFRFEWPIYTKSGQRIQIWHQNPFYVNFKHYVIAKNDIEVLRYTNLYKIEVKEFKFEVKTNIWRHHFVIVNVAYYQTWFFTCKYKTGVFWMNIINLNWLFSHWFLSFI